MSCYIQIMVAEKIAILVAIMWKKGKERKYVRENGKLYQVIQKDERYEDRGTYYARIISR